MDKKIKNIIFGCLILILGFFIGLVVSSFKDGEVKENDINTTLTTQTTTTKKTNLVLKNNGVEVVVSNNEFKNSELSVKKVNVKIKNVNILAAYDINLKDSSGNIINVNDKDIKIALPYENKNNYEVFKVLYLSEKNEILETYNATYVNGKVEFLVNHLSRYAIVGEKKEKTTKVTKKTTVKETTTKSTTNSITETSVTTKKVVIYSYEWSKEGDQAGKYYLYVVDDSGKKVAGTVTLTSKATGESKSFEIPVSGKLFVKDNYTVSNAKGN